MDNTHSPLKTIEELFPIDVNVTVAKNTPATAAEYCLQCGYICSHVSSRNEATMPAQRLCQHHQFLVGLDYVREGTRT